MWCLEVIIAMNEKAHQDYERRKAEERRKLEAEQQQEQPVDPPRKVACG